MAVEKLLIEEKVSNQGTTSAGKLTAEEFNAVVDKINEVIDEEAEILNSIPVAQDGVTANASDKKFVYSSGDENAADCVMSMRDTAIAVSGSNLVLRKGMWNPTTQTGQYKTTAVPTATTEHAGAMSAEDKAKLEETSTKLSEKVDKVSGKGLSTNDFTDQHKRNLEHLDAWDAMALVSVFSGNPNHPHDETDEYYGTGVIVWDNDSHVDNYYNKGVLRIKGERINPNDGLPIANYGSGHTLDGVLYVFDSSLANGGGASDDCCVMQLLVLSNRVGGQEGDMYMRSGSGSSQGSLTWKPWEKFQTNIEVGAVSSLNGYVDNGMYSGVLTSSGETFVMVVINNYAIAAQLGVGKSITQVKFATLPDGTFTFEKRERQVGSTSWSSWVSVGSMGLKYNSGTRTISLAENASTSIALPLASTSEPGLMSAADKASFGTTIKWEDSVVTQTDVYRRALISGLKEIGYNDQEVMDCLSDVPNLTLENIQYAKEIMDNWDASTTDMTDAYRLNSDLVIMPKIDTSNVTTFNRTWASCINLGFIPQLDFSKATTFKHTFWYWGDGSNNPDQYKYTKLKRLYDVNLISVVDVSYAFCRIPNLTRIGKITIGSSCTQIAYMWQQTRKIPTDIFYKNLNLDWTSLKNASGGCAQTNATWVGYTHFYNATNLSGFYEDLSDDGMEYDLGDITFSSDCTTPVNMKNFLIWDYIVRTPKLDFPGGISNMEGFFCSNRLIFKIVQDYSQYTPSTFKYFIAAQSKSLIERIEGLNLANCSNTQGMFIYYASTQGRGGLNPSCKYIRLINLGQCEEGTVYWLNGVKNWGADSDENRQSLIDSLITNSFDRTSAGYVTATLHLDNDVVARLTDEEKAAIIAKGYTITIYS